MFFLFRDSTRGLAVMSENLERLKKRRRENRGVATKKVQEAKALLEGESKDDSVYVRIRDIQSSLEEKLKLLKELDETILQVCPTEEIEVDIVEADEANSRILTVISECKRFVSAYKKPTETHQHETSETVTVSALPEGIGRKSPPVSLTRIEFEICS